MQFRQDKIRLRRSSCHTKRILIKQLLAPRLALLQLPAHCRQKITQERKIMKKENNGKIIIKTNNVK